MSAEELEYWRALAEERGKVIRALHELNYWHESTVARGEVVAGLEASVQAWRERCLAAEAALHTARSDLPRQSRLAARVRQALRRAARA